MLHLLAEGNVSEADCSWSLISSIHSLLFGLIGYLILVAPQTFVFQRQLLPRLLPSPYGVPSNINTFYRYTRNSVILYSTLERQFQSIPNPYGTGIAAIDLSLSLFIEIIPNVPRWPLGKKPSGFSSKAPYEDH